MTQGLWDTLARVMSRKGDGFTLVSSLPYPWIFTVGNSFGSMKQSVSWWCVLYFCLYHFSWGGNTLNLASAEQNSNHSNNQLSKYRFALCWVLALRKKKRITWWSRVYGVRTKAVCAVRWNWFPITFCHWLCQVRGLCKPRYLQW